MKSKKTFKSSLFLLSAIAGFSIISYYIKIGNLHEIWWSNCFLIMTGGLASLALYNLAIRHRIFNVIISTGITIFLLGSILPLFEELKLKDFFPSDEFFAFIVISIVFLAIAFPTEGIVNKHFQKGDLILVPLISVLIAFVLIWSKENIFTPAILSLGYIIILFINISLKRIKNDNQSEEEIADDIDDEANEEDS